MLSLIFIQFLVFSAYCEFSVINQITNDPAAFVQTFSKANPAQIRKVITIIEGLISAGVAKKEGIIKDDEDAKAVLSEASGDLATALDEFETARGERKLADGLVRALVAKVNGKENAESAALEAKNLASDTLTDAQNWLDSENTRIDNERKILEEVIDVLRSLKDGGRRLLSFSSHLAPILPALIESAKVNPDSVDKVIAMVVDLINAGEAVRTSAKVARDDAKKIFDRKNAAWELAVQATIQAKAELSAARKDAAAKLVVEQDKEAIWEKALGVTEAAQNDSDEKAKIRAAEVPVIDHEDAELKKVIAILEKMIAKQE